MNLIKLEKYVKALKKGDSSAFDSLYDDTYKAVYFTIYRVLNDRQLSEDILQEVYLTAIKKINAYNEGTNFIGWLLTIAKRLAINEYNKRQREYPVDFLENETLYGEYYVEDKTDTGIFDIAKQILPDDELKIVMLCAMSGYKRREVAQIMAIPLPTVTWKYNNALKKLEKYLKEAEK